MCSVRSATTETGRVEDRYEYDAFGSPYKGDLSGGMNLGYTGKPYDTATGFYNYGFRDYNPTAARFTTVDPVRDGNNWFAYVNNDPVNYIDLWGLTASDNISNRLSMQEAFGTDYGPCVFRTLLALAETREGRDLTMDEITRARQEFYGNNTSWEVSGNLGGWEGAINKGLEILGSNESAKYLGSVMSTDDIPEGTQATMLRLPPDAWGNMHRGEGDASGNLMWDPLGYDTFTGNEIIQIDAFEFVPN